MDDHTTIFDNFSDNNSDIFHDGPSLHTRIAFVSVWIIIAVAGIIGTMKFFCSILYIYVFLHLIRQCFSYICCDTISKNE